METRKETKLTGSIISVECKYFPYLDLELYFSRMDKLRFRVHLKENQRLQYLNSESTHTCACLRAIPRGVFNRLAKLTSRKRSTMKSKMDDLYPDHCTALSEAGLLPEEIPMMGEVLRELKEAEKKHPRKLPD